MMKRAETILIAVMLIAVITASGCQPQTQVHTVSESPGVAKQPASPPPPPPVRTTHGGAAVDRMAPVEVIVGQAFTYKLKVSNITPGPLANVTVVETLPSGFTLKSTAPQATRSGSGLTWNLGRLAAGESKTLAVTGTAAKTGELKYCVDVTYKLPTACARIVAVQPALRLIKTGPAEVLICEPITFIVTVQNTGSGPATNVRITDELPSGLVAIVDGKETGTVVGNVGTLAPGKSARITVNARATKAGTFTNKASASADMGLVASATHPIRVRQPTLAVKKTGPAMRYLGRNATYQVTVSNTGDGQARGTILTDVLPSGMTLISADNGGKASGGKVIWDLGTIEPGASKKVSLTLRADRIGTARNVAMATAKCTKAQGETATAIKGIPAILLEVVDVEDPIEIGANVTYRIEVTNQGSAVGTGIKIVATLPPEQTYVSSTGKTKVTVVGKTVTFAPLGQLAPKAKAVYTIVTKGVKTGDVRFKVELTSDQMTSPVNESESTHIYE
jgi:uncharacterized repeat protein (TIGR01451 family)